MRRIIIAAVLCLLLPSLVAAQDEDSLRFRAKGFVDTYHALRTESPNGWMSSRTRIRGELSIEKGSAGAFLSTNLIYNAIIKDLTGIQLREAYGYFSDGHWDLRAGRQIIAWGVADGLRLTDIVSPMDFTEFLAQDYDDIRIPVNGVRLRYSRENWNIEAVAIPVSSFYLLPTDAKNPWSVGPVPIGAEPPRNIGNMEYGGRLSCFLHGADFAVSALHTWNKMPVICHGVGKYRRMDMLGADLSMPVGQFVVRGEAAEYFGEAQPTMDSAQVPRAASSNLLIGLDWYAGNDWSLSAQYAHKYVDWGAHRHSGMATFRISKELLNNTLTLQDFAYIDVTNGGFYNRLSADYSLNDQLHVDIGYDHFHGDEGTFAIYKHNSEVWVKLKYSF